MSLPDKKEIDWSSIRINLPDLSKIDLYHIEKSTPSIPAQSVKEERIYTRGASAPSLEEAVRRRLVLYNYSSRQSTDHNAPPGLFFSAGQGSLTSAEAWAVMAGERESKLPITMQLVVNEQNFAHIAGRIFLTRAGFGGSFREGVTYQRVYNWSELIQLGVAIALFQLSHEDLIALNCIVGTGQKKGEFIYHPYSELVGKYIRGK